MTKELSSGRYRGPLYGVPVAIKDLFHLKDKPTTFGSLAYKDFTAGRDATAVERLRNAGSVILGRLHLHEGTSVNITQNCQDASNRGTAIIGRAGPHPALGRQPGLACAMRA